MKKIDTNNLKRYQSGKYKDKIDWYANIGEKLKFIYGEISGEFEIVNYIKAIPQGTLYIKYQNVIYPIKTNNFMNCKLSKILKLQNYDFLYKKNDVLNTKFGGEIIILDQIKLFHTKSYERGYTVKCLSCNHIYDIREVHITSCPNCSDRVSYPEKFVINLFYQLGEEIELQKMFEWAGLKRYDLYVPRYNMIVEINGLIHYEPCFLNMINKNKNETNMYKEFLKIKENDREKFENAITNGISNYIIIDAKESNESYIKHSILNKSSLSNFYDLNNIDWLTCNQFATKSIVKKIADLYNDKFQLEEICNIIQLSKQSVQTYLREGNKFGYCIYDKHINMSLSSKERAKFNYKPVICLNTGEIFKSQSDAAKFYGVYKTGISDCCNGRISSAGKHPNTGESLKWTYYNPQ